MKKKSVVTLFVLILILSIWIPVSFPEDDIKLKMVAINPSETKSLNTTIQQYLPSEVTPEDVLDKKDFEVIFDSKKKSYYVTKEIELQPKEVRTIELRIRNVWEVPAEEMDAIRETLDKRLGALKGTKYEETGSLLYEKAIENLNRMAEEQNRKLGMQQRIELYRAHKRQIEEIEANGISLEAMRQMEDEKTSGVRLATFIVSAQNPSSEPKTMSVRSPLPKEVMPQDVVENPGFVILYDEQKKTYVLSKEDEFAPNETKEYKVSIRDVWYITDEELKFQRDQMSRLVELFQNSPFTKYVDEQASLIFAKLDEIIKLQEEVSGSLNLEDRIRAYVLNTQKLEVAKKKIRDIQELLTELPLKRKDQELKMRIKHLVKKVAEKAQLVLMAIGYQPDSPITWWIIFGIVAFLALISTVFYVTWLKKLQENKWQKPVAKNASKEPMSPPAESSENAEDKVKSESPS